MAYFQICPRCGSDDVSGNPKRDNAHCLECGFTSASGETLEVQPPLITAGAQEWDLSQLPSVVALPLHEYANEPRPVLKLWHACDAIELMLRLLVMVGLAELRGRGPLAPALVNNLRDSIEEPTLGRWKNMVREVATQGRKETALSEFFPLVNEVLLPFLDGPANGERNPQTSFSALRNQLAHGGGVTQAVAEKLLVLWEAPFADLIKSAGWLSQLDLVVKRPTGGLGVLRGPQTQPLPYEFGDLGDYQSLLQAFRAEDDEDVVVVFGDQVWSLWPLHLYGLPRAAAADDEVAQEAVPQIYVRRGEVNLHLTPVGSAEACHSETGAAALEEFQRLFKLDDKARGFSVRGFETEMSRDAMRLVGRTDELAVLQSHLAAMSEGVLWLAGMAGIGKSYLLARVATELIDAAPIQTLILPYRFKIGDGRCTRQSFLQFAIERLEAWDQLPSKLSDEDEKTERQPKPVEKLRELLSQLQGCSVLFILDGLDEICARDAGFIRQVVLELRTAGVKWLCAGRPEGGIPAAMSGADIIKPFPDALPSMSDGDIRTMLLEKIGPLRQRLVSQDYEEEGRVLNRFVTKVAASAAGLPLYVTYVIGDVLSNRFRALDAGERLPPSLEAYHEELLRRCGVGMLHQVLTPLAATLAAAHEPLTAPALAVLLKRRTVVPAGEEGLQWVMNGLSAIASMIKRSVTPEGEEGYTLYHLSLRQHMNSSATMRDAVVLARQSLALAAQRVETDAAATYLYRQGIRHLLEISDTENALNLLTDFGYLMSRLQTLPNPDGTIGLGNDWRSVIGAIGSVPPDVRLWEAFFREREHILRRGNEDWPAYKILLQLANEHADDSPVTQSAEAWLATGACDWVWLRRGLRVANIDANLCLLTLEGHTSQVAGAIELSDKTLLSWSQDEDLRIWDHNSGECLYILRGHTSSVTTAIELSDEHILSWSSRGDADLGVWDRNTGECITILRGHTSPITGAIELSDGHILSWSSNENLRVWDRKSEECIAILEGHDGSVKGAIELSDGHILSWSSNENLRVWDRKSEECIAILEGHDGIVKGAIELSDGHILSWSWSEHEYLRIWDSKSGNCLRTFKGTSVYANGAIELSDGRILFWNSDLGIWDSLSGDCLQIEEYFLPGISKETKYVDGAMELSDGHILSWYRDGNLRIWDSISGDCIRTLEGWSHFVNGAIELSDGRLLSWSKDRTLKVWSADLVKGQGTIKKDSVINHASCKPVNKLEVSPQDFFTDGFEVRIHSGCLSMRPSGADTPYIYWHSVSQTLHRVSRVPLMVWLDNRQICLLELYNGNQRIELAELNGVLGLPEPLD